MHYYATYALATAAGIPKPDAAVIAYAAQFTDDSTRYDSKIHDDGGLFFGIATSAHPAQFLIDLRKTLHGETMEEQRRIWVPFHFFPGGQGHSFQEKILCVKDGPIVREMLNNHLEVVKNKAFALELIGLSAHVYADTFSHYGFSGMTSPYNEITGEFELVEPINQEMLEYVTEKKKIFLENLSGSAAREALRITGHSSVATYPDRPYLHWRCTFTRPRPGQGTVCDRDNQATFFEACEKLYDFFSCFARKRYADSAARVFSEIAPKVKEIIACQGKENQRLECWQQSGLANDIPEYFPEAWEREKTELFSKMKDSSEGIQTNAYRFHQAAAYHRYYVLKDLLPSHGIAVY